jgi:hypothetical protein
MHDGLLESLAALTTGARSPTLNTQRGATAELSELFPFLCMSRALVLK